jgi:tRNA pseudouridine13 synthase
VGFAGRKDRRAVTLQWFSVPGLDASRAFEISLSGARILAAVPHPHKLRTGQLRGNRFEIVVRDLDREQAEEATRRLGQAERRGFPNRFGEQRFGLDGRNAERGARVLSGDLRLRDRRQARFLLSSLQSAVFNEVLSRRGEELGCLQCGDIAVVHSSGGLFRVEDVDREQPRADLFEISPTGPIFGSRVLSPAGSPLATETGVLCEFGLSEEMLTGQRLRGSRRALRARPEAAAQNYEDGVWRLGFSLPSGSYASVLLSELLPGLEIVGSGKSEHGEDGVSSSE